MKRIRVSVFVALSLLLTMQQASAQVQDSALLQMLRESLPPGWYNVRDPQFAGGAVGDGCSDDQPAIQAAIDAAALAGGGTVYLPAGRYNLVGNAAPNAHLLIDWSGIALVGDANSRHASSLAVTGTRLVASSTDLAVISISAPPSTAPDHVIIRDIGIDRGTCAGGEVVPTSDAVGILFDTSRSAPAAPWIRLTEIENVNINNHYDGIRSAYYNTSYYVVIDGIRMRSVVCSDNARHGCMINVGGGRVTDCAFRGNGTAPAGSTPGSGCGFWYDSPLITEDDAAPGTFVFANCTFTGNGDAGLRLLGSESPPGEVDPPVYPANVHDIHIASCQFDANQQYGLHATLFANVNIAASSFTANGANVDAGTFPNLGGLLFEEGHGLSISGCTIRGGAVHGLVLDGCKQVAVSGVNFDNNSRYHTAADAGYNIKIVDDESHGDSENISLSGLSIHPRAQANGIGIFGEPVEVLGTGIVFDDSFVSVSGTVPAMFGPPSGLGSLAAGQIEYWNPDVNRPAFVPDPTGGTPIDANARAAIVSLIDRLIELGLIPPVTEPSSPKYGAYQVYRLDDPT